ncbi:type I-E CRISPR-associated endoribonuclease Cas2 [Natronosporangium hydrolyticum]|uniref:Type I-E CRISPR-associated endoribonuclease Cas2 n=1 Tax=Natronosporangium hydrolyticum TaxID=2811111 RepID=A0A895YIJ7_9ACTN|nr:type I-E CRISPR-associated endoribonuclease Cas2e [Natronosporangium hydrolyticum]QSB14406.1 type I-E CRISPR-associated endoribonuclease Cas2 [Natronosporangium hydrolyticum]
MVVLVLTACPEGLRGHLTRWLLEISAGVFVGHISARVRTLLWARVVQLSGDGRAIMVYSQRGEQRLSFEVHNHHWRPVDYDGVRLMMRPSEKQSPSLGRTGWSKAGRRKRFGQGRRSPTNPPSQVNEKPQDHG